MIRPIDKAATVNVDLTATCRSTKYLRPLLCCVGLSGILSADKSACMNSASGGGYNCDSTSVGRRLAPIRRDSSAVGRRTAVQSKTNNQCLYSVKMSGMIGCSLAWTAVDKRCVLNCYSTAAECLTRWLGRSSPTLSCDGYSILYDFNVYYWKLDSLVVLHVRKAVLTVFE